MSTQQTTHAPTSTTLPKRLTASPTPLSCLRESLNVLLDASPAEIFNLLSASVFCLFLVAATRRILVYHATLAKSTETMIDDILCRIILLFFAPTALHKLDVHTVCASTPVSLCRLGV